MMNTLLNYFVEANLGLCLMLLMYVLFLKNENDFAVKRMFLLVSVGASLLFPLIQIDGFRSSYLPTLMQVVPVTWLPEITVVADGSITDNPGFEIWPFINTLYAVGLVSALSLFLVRLFMIVRTLWPLRFYQLNDDLIFESNDNRSSFSFFHCIYIGQADQLSVDEKAMIIHHEHIHAQRMHSFDILLINLVGVFFWFNPVVALYRKAFIQLHEFEADARSVSTREVDNYCSLLAKVALLSADIKLANHFSNSLTIKRINMMRTIKAKIKRWKYVALAALLPSLFFVVACQEQVANDLTKVARNANNAILVPEHVQTRYDDLKKTHPDSKFMLLDLNQEAVSTLQGLEAQYGSPRSIELFKPGGETQQLNYTNTVVATAGSLQVAGKEGVQPNEEEHTYAIVEYNEGLRDVIENAKSPDAVYTMVDEAAQFPGGLEELVKFLQNNLKYPKIAREQGVEGTVFVVFVVETDGSVTSVEPIKGLSPETDAEATRVVQMFPKWIPGKNGGEVVRSSFVIPLRFKLGTSQADGGK